jgi:hypothetical protein
VKFTSGRFFRVRTGHHQVFERARQKRDNKLNILKKKRTHLIGAKALAVSFWHQFYGDCSGNITANGVVLL